MTAAVFGWGRLERTEGEARALAFSCLVVANLGLILANRSWRRPFAGSMRHHNSPLWWIVGGAGALLGAVLAVPWLRDLFGFPHLNAADLLAALAAGAGSVLWIPLVRGILARRPSPAPA
jgi:P-type Ca2+ transporter type 2C